MQEDVNGAIQAKDEELDQIVANMDEDELNRTLVDCVPSGIDDLNLWKRDCRKRYWRRLSAFGVVRDDPSLYRQWKQQGRQQGAAQVEIGGKREMLGTTCATDAARRQPWSTDLHYSHKCRVPQHSPPVPEKEHVHASVDSRKSRGQSATPTQSSGDISRPCTPTTPLSRRLGKPAARTRRPASASADTASRVAARHAEPPETTRTPGLARLARVFYQSSVASTASMHGACLRHSRDPKGDEPHARRSADGGRSAQITRVTPENGDEEATTRPEAGKKGMSSADSHADMASTSRTRDQDRYQKQQSVMDVSSTQKRMEDVRVLWAVSQLSTEAVTKKIMHGYAERERAREPNRTRWMLPSSKPQPPAKTRERRGVRLSKRHSKNMGARVLQMQST